MFISNLKEIIYKSLKDCSTLNKNAFLNCAVIELFYPKGREKSTCSFLPSDNFFSKMEHGGGGSFVLLLHFSS